MGLPASGPPRLGQASAADDFATREYPFTEPLIVPSVHVDGIMVHVAAGIAHFVGWQMIEPLCEGSGERRVIFRSAMSEMEARAFRYTLGMALRDGH